MSTIGMPMPGALRWRALHPLTDGDGTCSLIYDLERAAVLEVPEELRLHVAPALETGDPDDDLLSWLVREDLITMEGWGGWGPDGQWFGAAAGDRRCAVDGEPVHVRIDALPEEAALHALDMGFRQAFGAHRVQLHLDWGGTFPEAGLVERVAVEAKRMAADAGQEVSLDLALDADQVTPAVSLLLSSLPVHIRLRCGLFQGGDDSPSRGTRRAVLLFWMEDLADRVTLDFTLAPDARLKDLWTLARRLGVRHLDVRTGAADAHLEEDLLCVVEETVRDLAARAVTVDFRPVTRIVRRLLQSEPLALFREDTIDGRPAEGGTVCGGCWARYLCRNSALLVSESAAEARTPESCAVWGAEAEAALRLYHRLAHADPLQVLRVFGEPARLPDELPAGSAADWSSKAPC
jgi:hypothetical protein